MRLILTTAALLASMSVACAQSFAKAEMLLEHGLTTDAQKELIDLVHAAAPSPDKPKALNLLASIAIEKNNLKAAADTWTRLINLYPASAEAIVAKAKLPLLVSALDTVNEHTAHDAAARLLLRNADFWAKGRDRVFNIDTSWLANVDAAVHWYDRVVTEFPGTSAARTAYEEKIRTLLGWKESGPRGAEHGLRSSTYYLPVLESTFRDYERSFPQAIGLQAFRYQIAQAHWQHKDWQKTRDWLNEILEKDGSAKSFYRDLAERRLKYVEY